MNFKLVVLALFLFSSIVSNAQNDTLYFNRIWQKVDKSDTTFTYTRIVSFISHNKYKIEDYFHHDILIMTGTVKCDSADLLNGPISSGLKYGQYVYYDALGNKQMQGAYKDGFKDGLWEVFFPNGKISKQKSYNDGLLVSTTCYDTLGGEINCNDEVLRYTTTMPKPQYDLQEYIDRNIVYPETQKDKKEYQKVIVSFVIDEDGDIGSVVVENKDVDISFQKEAINLVSQFPNWQSGSKNGGKRVNVKYTLPIEFKVSSFASDTFYYDKRNYAVEKGDKSIEYYRVVGDKYGNKYAVRDYYKNGVMKSDGMYSIDNKKLYKTPMANLYRVDRFTNFYKSGIVEDVGDYKYGQKDGKWMSFYDTSKVLKSIQYYSVGKDDEEWKFYYENGNLQELRNYKNFIKHGLQETYYENGQVCEHVVYKEGVIEGDAISYYNNGNVRRKTHYDSGFVEQIEHLLRNGDVYKKPLADSIGYLSICYDSTGTVIDCKILDANYKTYNVKMPKPPYNVNQYLGENLRYPQPAKDYNLSGRVQIQFIVDEDGYIINPQSLTPEVSVHLQAEALRVISLMPRWSAGSVDGVPANLYYTLPIVFMLE